MISPLIKSKWDQGAPYNNECPEIRGQHCFTGCVATSMAQVLNYFKYPEFGSGTASVSVGTERYTIDFSERAFDWDNMLDNYVSGTYNDSQASAVAYLMKACGFSVDMAYGLEASGASSQNIANAFVKYFNYDPSVTFEARLSYSGSEWDEKIYNSLKAGSPVIYNGNDLSVGHSFICDGYDGNGYYHINWGWGGMSDGYFLLNALNPEALGTGGGEGGGFNFLQGAVLNLKKPNGQPATPSEPKLSAYGLIGFDSLTKDAVGNDVLTCSLVHGYGPIYGWRNETGNSIKFNIGGVFVNSLNNEVVESQQGKFGGMNSVSLMPGGAYAGTVRITVTIPSSLPDGEYKMILSTRDNNSSSSEWIPVNVPYGYPDYIVIKKNAGKVSASSVEPSKLVIKDFKLDGNLYYGRSCNISFNVENSSDLELTEAISIILSEGDNVRFKSTNILVTVPPHSSEAQSWSLLLYPQEGQGTIKEDKDFNISLVNDFSGESYGSFGTVTMKPNPGDPSVQLRSMTIPGASSEETVICGDKYNVLVVEDSKNFDVDLKIKVSKGYFDSNIYVDIVELAPNATSPNQTVPVKDQVFTKHLEMNAGEEATLNIPISFPEAQNGNIYYVKVKYYGTRSEKLIGSLRFKVKSGSGLIDINIEENEEYYNLQGVRIETPIPGEIMIVKKGSKIEKRILK